ncbi:16S rRNA (cytosine(1402)-N(4))-methyltransferase RsmH, partial [Neisseria sp. P0013.S009]
RWAVVKEADLPQPPLNAVGKAIKPAPTETEANPRARSAVLRVAERSSGEFSVVE